MNYNFNEASVNSNKTVSLQAIRSQAERNLVNVQKKLSNKGVSASLINVKNDPVGDLGGLESLIVDAVLWFPVSSFLGASIPLMEAFNHASAAAYTEGLSILVDDKTQSARGKLNDYPEGRRRGVLSNSNTSVSFNLLSSAHKKSVSSDVQAEMDYMNDILDMLNKLDNVGAKSISLEEGNSAYDAIKKISSMNLSGGKPVRNYNLSTKVA